MKKQLSFLTQKATFFLQFILILFSMNAFAQTTVVTQFNFNTTPTAFDPAVNNTVGLPFSMKLFNASHVQIAPNVVAGTLELSVPQEGSYLELEFNSTNFYDLNVDFDGEMANSVFGSGKWTLQEYNAVANSYTTLGSLNFGFLNYSGSLNRNLSINANNNPSVKIRIVAETIDQLIFSTRLRLDNLVITSKSPKINLFGYNTSNALQQITVNAPASIVNGTDFGIVVTEDPAAVTKTFRISNTGTAALQISNITFTGNNPADFSWVPYPASPAPFPVPINPINSLPTTINVGFYKDFIIKFDPSAEGKRSALLNIFSNAVPSPFSFFVEGRGATCKTEDLVLKRNTMEVSQPSNELLSANIITGSFKKISGTNHPGAHTATDNPLNTLRLYPNSNSNLNNAANTYNLFTTFNSAWYQRGNTISTIEFGAVNVANEKGVYISFNLAAFSTVSSTDFSNSDYVELQVLKPGTTNDWSSELRVRGGSAANENSRYSFDGGATASTFYDGDDSAMVFTNGSNLASKYAKIQLKLPGTANFQNVIFRIVASNSSNAKLWLIDDVAVYSANAVFRTYKPDGTWRDSGNNSVTAPNEATQTYKNFKAIFEGNFTVPAAGLTVCECEVNNGVNLTIPANRRLTVQTSINNIGNGTNFIINDGGNLIQIEDEAVNTGNLTAEKVFTFTNGPLPANDRKQYNYVISPVVGQNIKTIYAGTNTVIFHKEANNFFYASDGAYVPGRGLGIKEPSKTAVPNPNPNTTVTTTANYFGVPFNGILGYPLAYSTTQSDPANRGFNLVGNPYPSNIDIDKLYSDNSTKIESTFYFWDNRGNTSYGQAGSGYTGDNYAKYNASNGTGISIGIALGTPRVPTKDVKVGTAFMIQAKSTANGRTLNFDNAMRSADNSGPGFLGKSSQNEEKDRYWLTLKTPLDMQFMNAIVYFENGSKDFGSDDTETFGASDDIYTIVGDHKIAIQGRDNFQDSDKVDLGLSLFQSGMHSISIYKKEGVFENGQNIYLKDHQTGIITNLSEGNYTFQATAGENTGRFQIIYKPETILTTESLEKEELLVYRDGGDFVVKAPNKKITDLEVFDVSGRMIMKLKPNNTKAVISGSALIKGMYLLKVDQGGVITSKKILK